VLEFGGEDYLARRVIDDGESCRLAARVDLETQPLYLWRRDNFLQDERKRIATIYRRLPLRQEQTRLPRMDRVKRLSPGIYDKYMAQ
jgi:hypothetical protein